MQLIRERVLQAMRRSVGWGAANPQYVPPRSGPAESWAPITRQYDALGIVVVRMEEAGAQQNLKAVHTTLIGTNETSLRAALRQETRPVAQVAQVLRKKVPGIGNLKMPGANVSVESQLTHGKSFVEEASTYQDVLLQHGVQAGFIERINGSMAALKASLDGRGAARAAQTAATKEQALCVREGMEYLKLMDAALTVALRDNPAKLREWKNARRIMKVGAQVPGVTQAPAPVNQANIAGTPPQQEIKTA